MYEYQRRLVKEPRRELVVVSATQIGKTVACAVWLFARALFFSGTRNWWVAPTYSQAEVGYEYLKAMGNSVGQIRRATDHRLRFSLRNGSVIECRSWEREENLQGPSVHSMVVDEAGLLTMRARSILSSRRSATLGPVRYIGNPSLTGSEFWLLCQHAAEEENADRYAFLKWTWKDKAAALQGSEREEYVAFIDEEKRSLPPEEFARLYEADWSQPEGAIFAGIVEDMATLEESMVPHSGHPYVVAWDIGVKIDYTVGVPLCTKCFTVTDIYRKRGGATEMFKRDMVEYTRHWNEAEMVVEVNGPGHGVLDDLAARYRKVTGWTTTNSTKRSAVFEVLRRGREGGLTIAKIRPMMEELRVYQSKQSRTTQTWTFEAPQGAHDDTVSGLLIAIGAATGGGAGFIELLKKQVESMKAKQAEAARQGAEGSEVANK